MVRKKKKQQPKMVRKKKKKQQQPVLMGPEEIRLRQQRAMSKYAEVLEKYEGFDLYDCSVSPTGFSGLSAYLCNRYNPCCDLVLLYARMGLHRYNLLQGKDLQLSVVERYNKSICTTARSYYITLKAKDPANHPPKLQTFQARVDERKYNHYVLTCSVARLAGETNKTNKTITDGEVHPTSFMPQLPPENPFKDDDTNPFYVLKESELQDNDDWIRLYLELAVATTNRSSENHSLTNLKILKVAMESAPYRTQGILAHDATFYIRYEDSCEARAGKDVDRVAIVRRILDDQSQNLTLVGLQESSQTIITDLLVPFEYVDQNDKTPSVVD